MSIRSHPRWIAVLSLSLVFATAACDRESDDPASMLSVVATTSILGDIAENVVGEEGEVEVLIPIGADAHDFAPSSQQASLIATANLVVANGLGLEAGLQDVLASAAEDGVQVIELAPVMDPIPFPDGDGLDPHFWMDPARVGLAAQEIAEALSAVHDGMWMERADQYVAQMETTNQEVEDALSSVHEERREMVTNHQAFGYFADRYGFEILGVVIPGGATLAEPSSAQLADLVAVMEQSGTRVIFAETSEPVALAEAVAGEVGEDVEVVQLFTESLGGPGSGAETLSQMLLNNARRIAEALG